MFHESASPGFAPKIREASGEPVNVPVARSIAQLPEWEIACARLRSASLRSSRFCASSNGVRSRAMPSTPMSEPSGAVSGVLTVSKRPRYPSEKLSHSWLAVGFPARAAAMSFSR